MVSSEAVLSSGFVLFSAWLVAALSCLICLITLEHSVLGSFTWNYQPEVDLLLAQNSSELDIYRAEIHAKDVASMKIISYLVISLVIASLFMVLFIWRSNVKDLLEKAQIEKAFITQES